VPPPPPPASEPPRPVEQVKTPPPPPPPDPVDVLITQAQAEYAAGLKDYQVGNTEQARAEFDRAVGLMLESKLDLNGDERLKTAFQKLVDDIHSLEASAVEPGGAPNENRYEAAPIESFTGLTFPVDPKVSQRVQDELKTVHSDLPLVSNEIVDGVITHLQGRGSGFIKSGLRRIGQYRHVYEAALQREGLPQDLVYLAAAESAFNPFALSRAGAKGIWQLMLSRGMEYGLRKDRWVDEREDPVKSTDAAVRHLKDLYQMFGDWFLVMAAYNSGPVTIQKAIEKTGYADFWTLHRLRALPTETENHVPIILAIAIIAKDPKAYGIDVEPDPPVETDDVIVESPVDLRLVAQLINRPVEEIIRLNPGLLRWTTPANNPNYILHLPKGAEPTFTAAIAAFPADKRVWWRAHTVENGDTLTSVARKFKVTTVSLAKVNNLEPKSPLDAGARLVLPLAPGDEASLSRVRDRGPRRPFRYKIRPGDTLERIADRFDVTPYQIRRWNKLSSTKIIAGRSLLIHASSGGKSAPRRSSARRSRTAARPSQARKNSTPAKTQPGAKAVTSGAPPASSSSAQSRASR
jgi:membrane-bound lytic murein transglycosylase D